MGGEPSPMEDCFWAGLSSRHFDVPIRQPGADAHLCDQLSLAVLKIRALSAIAAERWLAYELTHRFSRVVLGHSYLLDAR